MIAYRKPDNLSCLCHKKDVFMHTFYYKMKHGALDAKYSKRVYVNTDIYVHVYTYILLVHAHLFPDAVGVLAAVRVWLLSCAVWVFIILL